MKLLIENIKTHIPVLSLILSAVGAWLMFPITTGFPLVAFTILFAGVSSLIYVLKKNKELIDTILYVGILSLSFFLLYRANEFLQFFDFVFIIFALSILARPLINIQGIFNLLISPFTVFLNTLSIENIFRYKFTKPSFIGRGDDLREYASALLLTVIIMLVTIPLLASANPIFNNLLGQIIKLLNLGWLGNFFAADSVAIYILRIFAFIFLSFMIPRLLTVTIKGIKVRITFPVFSINYLIPKIAMSGVLIIFFITQLQLYFASPELLKSLGYTNAQLTREVFAQVTVVAFIVLILTYLDKNRKKWNTQITYILLMQAFFLIAIAFKSVYDYSGLYGYTQKRLWGYASMTWLAGTLILYLYHFYKQTSEKRFIKQILAFSVIVIFMINLLNFDNIIFRTAKPGPTGAIDYKYISGRSVDAHYYNEVLPRLINDIQAGDAISTTKEEAAMRMIRSINQLRDKYTKNDYINSFNIAEYREYHATRHMNIKAYEKILTDKQQN